MRGKYEIRRADGNQPLHGDDPILVVAGFWIDRAGRTLTLGARCRPAASIYRPSLRLKGAELFPKGNWAYSFQIRFLLENIAVRI